MGMTIAEKILSRHSGHEVRAGDIVVADLDFLMGQDGTSLLNINAFHNMGGQKVFDPSKAALVIDHGSPSPTEGVSAQHAAMRAFAREQGIILYDVGEGICHQLLPERGHVVPGDLVLGSDSHTCSYGALNALATGVGSTDLGAALLTGKSWFRVPDTIKIILKGKLPRGVFAKDVSLFLVGQIGADGATYKAIEYEGEVIETMTVESRLVLANMAVEMGAKTGLMAADEKALRWVAAHSNRPPRPANADIDAFYDRILEYDLSSLEPQIAKPHQVDRVVPLSEVVGTEVQQALLGTCAGGRLEDLQVAAQILARQRVHPDTRLILAPASRRILQEGMEQGIIQVLVEAGATLIAPGCGPCVGSHGGIPGDGENVISAANRNFRGRMGNNKASIYLASPAAVAASAIAGRICDPREFIR